MLSRGLWVRTGTGCSGTSWYFWYFTESFCGFCAADLFVEAPQLSVLPQRVQHLSCRLHHLHRVPGRHTVWNNLCNLFLNSAGKKNDSLNKSSLHVFITDLSCRQSSYPFPRPLLMSTSFSMPPLSAKALAFSMLRLVTSCSVQQTDATVSSDSTDGLPPGSRFTRSRMAYFPAGGDAERGLHSDWHKRLNCVWNLTDAVRSCRWRLSKHMKSF